VTAAQAEVVTIEALTDADIAAIAQAEVPAEQRHLDRELDLCQ